MTVTAKAARQVGKSLGHVGSSAVNQRRARARSFWFPLLSVAVSTFLIGPANSARGADKAKSKPFRYSIKRPFPFSSNKILTLPDNPFIESRCVVFSGSPNFFEVNVGFEHKGTVDPKRVIVAEIHLFDTQGKTIAAQTYQCPDTRVGAGAEVMPGIRACSIQSIDLSHCDKNVRDRVAEVEFVFKRL
jgi:hypothetical protein